MRRGCLAWWYRHDASRADLRSAHGEYPNRGRSAGKCRAMRRRRLWAYRGRGAADARGDTHGGPHRPGRAEPFLMRRSLARVSAIWWRWLAFRWDGFSFRSQQGPTLVVPASRLWAPAWIVRGRGRQQRSLPLLTALLTAFLANLAVAFPQRASRCTCRAGWPRGNARGASTQLA